MSLKPVNSAMLTPHDQPYRSYNAGISRKSCGETNERSE